jgi:hypothetical protein
VSPGSFSFGNGECKVYQPPGAIRKTGLIDLDVLFHSLAMYREQGNDQPCIPFAQQACIERNGCWPWRLLQLP